MPRGAPQWPGATGKPSGAEGKWLGADPESRGHDPSGMGRTPNVAGRAPRQKGCAPRRVWVRKSRAGRAPCHFSAPENHPGRTKSLMPDTPKVKSHAPDGGRSCWRNFRSRERKGDLQPKDSAAVSESPMLLSIRLEGAAIAGKIYLEVLTETFNASRQRAFSDFVPMEMRIHSGNW